MKHNTHLSQAERDEIAILLEKKYTHRAIARVMKRHHDSIDEEIKKNSTKGIYDARKAHAKSRHRRRMAKYQGMKLIENLPLKEWVEEKLMQDWSPEEIAGRLKYQEPERGYISFSAIYRYLETAWGEKFKKCLRYQGKGYSKGKRGISLSDRVMIDKRPKHIEKRRQFGHWEFDFIVSGKKGKGALLVCVERKSRYTLIYKLRNRKVETINFFLEALVGAHLYVASVTIDNDTCFRHHKEMSDIIGAPIYFCHPYHSWEKGTVENMNKWIRQYIKKGSSISRYSKAYIASVQEKLNNRPRKCLKYQTPAEVFEHSQALQQKVDTMAHIHVTQVAELRG